VLRNGLNVLLRKYQEGHAGDDVSRRVHEVGWAWPIMSLTRSPLTNRCTQTRLLQPLGMLDSVNVAANHIMVFWE
jgi:hypothetical protein